VRTAASLDGEDAFCREGFMLDEEFLIFAGEDVVGDHRDVVRFAKHSAKSERQGSFARADRPSDSDCESSF